MDLNMKAFECVKIILPYDSVLKENTFQLFLR